MKPELKTISRNALLLLLSGVASIVASNTYAAEHITSDRTVSGWNYYSDAVWVDGTGVTVTIDGSGNILETADSGDTTSPVDEGFEFVVGRGAGSSGIVNVRNGGQLIVGNKLFVGQTGGDGTLVIGDGGLVTTKRGGNVGLIGDASTKGLIRIEAGGKLISQSGDFYIGGTNHGVLDIEAGGTMTLGSASSNQFIVGQSQGSLGEVYVKGNLNLTGGGNVHASIGNYGTGLVEVTDGGIFTVSGYVRVGENSGTGSVLVSGAGSRFETTGAGSFVIGNGSGTGSVTVADGGLLKAGSKLVQVGRGTGNGYLNIGAGLGQTAQAAGTVDTSTAVQLYANGSLVFNYTEPTYTFASHINGTGTIVQVNAGTKTILTYDNTDFTGQTIISGGTLQLGNGGTTGAVGGNITIASGATLVADRTNTLLLSGVIDGQGRVVQNGTGTLTLSGNNTYTGGTEILSGKVLLQHANGASTGSILVSGGTSLDLEFSSPSFVNALSGSGTITTLSGVDVHLTGNSSSFSGSFTVDANSVLRASAQQNIGLANVNVAGTFNVATDGIWNLTSNLTGSGVLLKSGSGVLSVNQELASFAGETQIESGTVVVGEGSTSALLGGTVHIMSAGILSGTGTVDGAVHNQGTIAAFNALPSLNGYGNNSLSNLTVGPLTNEGTIILAGGQVGNTLTVVGGMTGVDGRIVLNTVFGDDSSRTDRLILDGGAATGSTSLAVMNQGGTGGLTNVGIQVVSAINGATTESSAFTLDPSSSGYRAVTSTLAIGAYDYSLVRGGNGGNAESWYLVSRTNVIPPVVIPPVNGGDEDKTSSNDGGANKVPSAPVEALIRPEAGVYQMNHQISRTMFIMSLHDRDGYAGLAQTDRDDAGWARVTGKRTHGRSAGNALSTSADTLTAQIGVDLLKYESPEYGTFYAGIMGGWGTSDTDSKSRQRNVLKASGTVNGYSVGAYGTWYRNDRGQPGPYIDTWAQYNWFNHEVRGIGLPKEKYDAQSFVASVEAGHSFLMYASGTTSIYLEPQLQLAYINYTSGSLTEASGTLIRYKGGSGLLARAGARLYGQFDLDNGMVLRPYLEANYWYNQKGGKLYMNNDLVPSGAPRSFGEVKLGISGEITKNLQAWGDVGTQFGGKHYNAVTGQVGLKYTW
ncbi:autotransporter outer membrane beta-barrel domain-containing protein [Microvirga sp. W0021]|uniref:Autotransporter outer membrane beta-barrel domain-containing protein n=1 Tax=Hohaiivirga grylli TaxID=3133970 RepID=A0ABV0BFH0_9HYPH